MSFDGLCTSISPRKIDHPKCTILAHNTIVLDVIFQYYFKESFFEDVICEKFSSGGYEPMESTIAMSRNLKEPPSVLKILLKRGTYDTTTG